MQKKGALKQITLLLPEKNHASASEPERIALSMTSISSLYDFHAQLLGIKDTKLKVIACDSGSDKSFDLLGAAKVVEQVKETIFGVWDRIRFHKNEKFSAVTGNFLEGLAAVDKIEEYCKKHDKAPDEAERLKRAYGKSIQGLIDSNSIIPELEITPNADPKKLFSNPTKRLTGPKKSKATKAKIKKSAKPRSRKRRIVADDSSEE